MTRLFETLRRVTARRSEQGALVLLVEDLHWFDRQSLNFLERLIESFPGSRTLVVTNFRPEFTGPWMRHSYYRQLPLAPLRDTCVVDLVSKLLGMQESLTPLSRFILQHTSGNPFFIEEVVKSLVEDGTLQGRPGAYRLARRLEAVNVPASVHAVLASRVDRLPGDQKRLLQTAAVMGRTFSKPVLAQVAALPDDTLTESLDALCAAELLQPITQEFEGNYRFWHPLTQEVAYRTLLADRRAAIHGRVAAALAEMDRARQDERAALIAGHFDAADDDLNAARWNARAATWGVRSSIDESLRRWRTTIDHLKNVPETPETLALGVRARYWLLRLGSRRGMDLDEAQAIFDEGRQLAERMSGPGPLALLFGMWGSIHFFGSDLQAGRGAWARGRDVAAMSGDIDAATAPFMAVAYACTLMGPIGEGLSLVEEAIDGCGGDLTRGMSHVGYSPLLRNFFTRGTLLALGGHLLDGRAEIGRAIRLARDHQQPELVAWALPELTHIAFLAGDGDSRLAEAQEAQRIAEESGNIFMTVIALRAVGAAQLLEGQLGEATAALTQALNLIEQHRIAVLEEATVLAYLARAHLADDDVAAAQTSAADAVAAARRQAASVVECFALATRTKILRETGAPRHLTETVISDAVRRINDCGATTYEPFIIEERGHLADDGTELREALRLYRQIGATGHAARLDAELSTRVTP